MKGLLLAAGVILVLTHPAGGAEQQDISIKKLQDESYELTLQSREITNVDQGQAAARPYAERFCGARRAQFGKFKFESSQAITPNARQPNTFALTQEFQCVDATLSAGQPAATKVGMQWPPKDSDNEMIMQLTYRYFAVKDAGRIDEGYSFLAPGMKSTTTLASWRQRLETFNGAAGRVINREIKPPLDWQRNPAAAPGPGIYVAVDFVSNFENLAFHCGYIAWHQEADGSFQVVREEEGYVDKRTAERLSAAQLAAVKARFRCR